jgi:hypothetical protein
MCLNLYDQQLLITILHLYLNHLINLRFNMVFHHIEP